MKQLGSSIDVLSQDGPVQPSQLRGVGRQLMLEIHDQLERIIIEKEIGEPERALAALNRLAVELAATPNRLSSATVRTLSGSQQLVATGLRAEAGGRLGLRALRSTERKENATDEVTAVYEPDDQLLFQTSVSGLAQVMSHSGDLSVTILVDEWSHLSPELQPYLAEFVRRCLLTVNGFAVKVAAVEYRTKLAVHERGRRIGLEAGADLAAAVDLDEHHVWEHNRGRLAEAYAEILFNHLGHELSRTLDPGTPTDRLQQNALSYRHGISTSQGLVEAVFEAGAFEQLCEASSGVIRDFLAITSNAIARTHRRSQEWAAAPRFISGRPADANGTSSPEARIRPGDVRAAAKEWFEKDKVKVLDRSEYQELSRIEQRCLDHLKSRYFLLRSEEVGDEFLQLLDARVIHRVARRYVHPDRVGERFDVFRLDYGSYMSLIDERLPDANRQNAKMLQTISRGFYRIDNPMALLYHGNGSF